MPKHPYSRTGRGSSPLTPSQYAARFRHALLTAHANHATGTDPSVAIHPSTDLGLPGHGAIWWRESSEDEYASNPRQKHGPFEAEALAIENAVAVQEVKFANLGEDKLQHMCNDLAGKFPSISTGTPAKPQALPGPTAQRDTFQTPASAQRAGLSHFEDIAGNVTRREFLHLRAMPVHHREAALLLYPPKERQALRHSLNVSARPRTRRAA